MCGGSAGCLHRSEPFNRHGEPHVCSVTEAHSCCAHVTFPRCRGVAANQSPARRRRLCTTRDRSQGLSEKILWVMSQHLTLNPPQMYPCCRCVCVASSYGRLSVVPRVLNDQLWLHVFSAFYLVVLHVQRLLSSSVATFMTHICAIYLRAGSFEAWSECSEAWGTRQEGISAESV